MESNKASTPASTGKIQESKSDSPHANQSPTTPETGEDQADNYDPLPGELTTTSTRNSCTIAPAADGLPKQVFGELEIRPIEHTVLEVPKSKSNAPNDRPTPHETDATSKPQIDALSILLEAQSSIDAAKRQKGHAEQTQLSGPPATRTEPVEIFDSPSNGMISSAPRYPVVVANEGGSLVTIHGADSSVVIQQDGLLLTAAPGSELSMGSHALSAAADGGAIVIDHSVTHAVPSSNVQSTALAIFVAGDDIVATYNQGSVVVSEDGSQTLTVRLGGAEPDIVVQQGTSVITLAAGQEITSNGHTLSVAQSGPALVVDGSVMTVTPIGLPDGSLEKVEAASDTQSANAADAAGATDTMDVTTSSASTPESSDIADGAALRSMANTRLCLVLLCLVSYVWAGVTSF